MATLTKKFIESEYNVIILGTSGRYTLQGINETFKKLTDIESYLVSFQNEQAKKELSNDDRIKLNSFLSGLKTTFQVTNLQKNLIEIEPNNFKHEKTKLDINFDELPINVEKYDTEFKYIFLNGYLVINEEQREFIKEFCNSKLNIYQIAKNHNTLSLYMESKELLIVPNLYENRKKTVMSSYKFRGTGKGKSNSHEVITREVEKVVKFDIEKVQSISTFFYNTETEKKSNIVTHYTKNHNFNGTTYELGIKHQKITSHANQQISFTGAKSSSYLDQYGISYSVAFQANGRLVLYVNGHECTHIANWSYSVQKKSEVHYKFEGNIVNDKDLGITLQHIKKRCNQDQVALLKKELSNNGHIISDWVFSYLDENKTIVKTLTIKYKRGGFAHFKRELLSINNIKINPYSDSLILREFTQFQNNSLIRINKDISIIINGDKTTKSLRDNQLSLKELEDKILAEKYVINNELNDEIQEYLKQLENKEITEQEYKELMIANNEYANKLLQNVDKKYRDKLDTLKVVIINQESKLSKLENLKFAIKNTNPLSAIKKLIDSAMNSSINKRLSLQLGIEQEAIKKVYRMNKAIEVKSPDGTIHKRTLKSIQKLIKKITGFLLSDNGLITPNGIFRLKAYRENSKGKSYIPIHELPNKIYDDFDKIIDLICRENTYLPTGKPCIIENSVKPSEYCKLNNRYLNQLNLEIIFYPN